MLIISAIPTDGQSGVNIDSTIVLEFDAEVDPASIQPGYLRLYNDNRQVSIGLTWQVTGNVVEIIPTRLLEEGYQYTLAVLRSDDPTNPSAAGIKSVMGEGLEETFTATFYTGYEVVQVDTTPLPYTNLNQEPEIGLDDSNLIPPDEGGIDPICSAIEQYGEDLVIDSTFAECAYNQLYFPENIVIQFDRPIDLERSNLDDILSVTVNDVPFSLDQMANARLNAAFASYDGYDGIAEGNVLTIPFDFDPYNGELPPLTADSIPEGRIPVWPNTEYVIRLKANRIYLEGVPYSVNWESTILGLLDPSYASVAQVRARVGYSLDGLDDCDIARMIQLCSLRFWEQLQQDVPSNLVANANRFVECCVLQQLVLRKLESIGDDNLKYRHQFGLEIGYEDATKGRSTDPYDDCMDDALRDTIARKHGRIKTGVKSALTAWYPSRRRGIYDRLKGFYRPNLP